MQPVAVLLLAAFHLPIPLQEPTTVARARRAVESAPSLAEPARRGPVSRRFSLASILGPRSVSEAKTTYVRNAGMGPATVGWNATGLDGLTPLEAWIESRVAALPGVATVAFLKHETTTYGRSLSSARSTRELEVTGDSDAFVTHVEQLLAGLRARAGSRVEISAAIVQGKPGASVPASLEITMLDEAAYRARLEALREPTGALEVLLTPKVLCLSGEEASVGVLEQHAFVVDYELQSSGASLVADPVIDVVQEGVLMLATPIVHPDGAELTAHVSFQLADLFRPVEEAKKRVGEHEFTIQLPEDALTSWNSGPLVVPLATPAVRVRGVSRISTEGALGRLPVEFLIHFRVVGAPGSPDTAPGRVVAADPETRIVVVEGSEEFLAAKPGYEITAVRRDGSGDAMLRVVRREGGLLLTEHVDGPLPAAGDGVRF